MGSNNRALRKTALCMALGVCLSMLAMPPNGHRESSGSVSWSSTCSPACFVTAHGVSKPTP